MFPGKICAWHGRKAPNYPVGFDAEMRKIGTRCRCESLPDEVNQRPDSPSRRQGSATYGRWQTLLQHRGISPDFPIGHSAGDRGVTFGRGVVVDVAGLRRPRLMAELPTGGAVAVASEEEVPPSVDGFASTRRTRWFQGEAVGRDIADHFAA